MFKTCLDLSRSFYSERERPTLVLEAQFKQGVAALDTILKVPLEIYQRDALLCLLSDLQSGLVEPNGEFYRSMLIKALNQKMYQIAAAEFFSFCALRGRVESKQWKKREWEHHLFLTGQLLST